MATVKNREMPVPHPAEADRASVGKQARTRVPRSAHAAWEPRADRDDPIAILQRQAEPRVQELVPLRYGRMATSAFAFYRGAAAIMAADLHGTADSGIRVQACGDAHVANFGLFASPERQLVFDINDFDETAPGPWEWDVKRLAASLEIAGRHNGFTTKERHTVVRSTVAEYRRAMRSFAQMRELELWYTHAAAQEGLPHFRKLLNAKELKEAARLIEKSRTKDNLQAFEKLTTVRDGQRRILNDPPLIVPADDLFDAAQAAEVEEQMHALLRSYRRTLLGDRRRLLERFRFVQIARKVVGVGSVGTRAWILLLLGRDNDDPLFLQAKEAEASVLEPFTGKASYANHGQRVVEGQRLMQAASDILLGWDRVTGFDGLSRDYYLRQLRDWKGSWSPEVMSSRVMAAYAQLCAWTLARAHARSGDRIAIASYLGSGSAFEDAIVVFAEAYADQNERDYDRLREAIASGSIVAQDG